MFRSLVIFLFLAVLLYGARLSDIVNIIGIRDHQLIGYGIVVGLKGTGDSTPLTNKSLANMLKNLDIDISPNDIKSKNIAAVIVTSKFNSFSRVGDKLNIKVSSIGNAKSISGGTLLLTPLKAVNGNVYALAQGSVGSSSGNGKDQSLTESEVLSGATVERGLNKRLGIDDRVVLSLKTPNFKNALTIQRRINKTFKAKIAKALDNQTVTVKRPKKYSAVEFIAKLDGMYINYSYDNKIIINEKSGTVIAGANVTVRPILISYKGIVINVTRKGNSILDITNTLKKLGATPKDVISVLNSMKQAGAILVKMEVI